MLLQKEAKGCSWERRKKKEGCSQEGRVGKRDTPGEGGEEGILLSEKDQHCTKHPPPSEDPKRQSNMLGSIPLSKAPSPWERSAWVPLYPIKS